MPVKEVEFEVVPDAPRGGSGLSRVLAWLLDDLIAIPGTKFRVGLDPIISLIPGLGDTSSTAMASLILIQAFRQRVPRIVIVRMAVNLLLNALLDAIPGVGNLFSAWFKSNRKNYQLLIRHAGAARASTLSDWIFIGTVLGVILVVGIGLAVVAAYLAYRVLALLFGHA